MEPWQSWAVVLAGAGGAYWYYTSQDRNRGRPTRAPSVSEEATGGRLAKRREDNKTKRKSNAGAADRSSDRGHRTDPASSDAGSANGRARKQKGSTKTSQAAPPAAKTVPSLRVNDDDDEDKDDKEWALQLARLKKGTNLAPPERSQSRNKTVKQSVANRSQEVSASSSTAGADGDDDLSSAGSPTLGALQTASAPSGSDISDMLEKPTPGPSVLRVLPSTQPVYQKQQQTKAAPAATETKKQRQNRRKAEERKLQREEDEKERRALLEKQLRTAREARGQPARNGVVSAPAPSSNAWIAPRQSTEDISTSPPVMKGTSTGNGDLLDTFDPKGSGPTPVGLKKPTSGSGNGWQGDVPSEEEQMRMISAMEDDANWSTVPKGKKGKKKAVESEGINRFENENGDTGTTRRKSSVSKDAAAKGSNAYSILTQGAGDASADPSSSAAGRHPNDSDWAVV